MAQETEQIKNYIKQSREIKVSDKEIAINLLHASWPINVIKDAFNTQKKNKPVIQVRGIFKEYQLSKEVVVHALNGIYSLDVYEGEFLSISGPSGSGKSTLLNILGLIDEPSAGDVLINGVSITKMNEAARTEYRLKSLSYVFQFFNLLENYTALENIMFQMRLGGVGYGKAKKRAMEILGFLGMENRAKNYPHELSGGEQQRIAIGRAISKDSPFLFADEPTAHLDTPNGEKVIKLLRQVNTDFDKTVILVSHEPTYTRMADRIAYLVDGRITSIENVNKDTLNWAEIEADYLKTKAETKPAPPATPPAESPVTLSI